MTLNASHANGGVIIFSVERILIYYDGVELAIEGGSEVTALKGKKKGRIYLTTHRMIFINKDKRDTLQSLSFPFLNLKNVDLEQPVFGANYIKGILRPEAGGGMPGEEKFKLWFNHGGAIEFGQALLQAGRLASRNRQPGGMTQPPPYAGAPPPIYAAPPPAYAPPQGQLYGFVPSATFPTAPPANSVYMTDAPPPYPGIDPAQQQQQQNGAAAGKAAEAAASGGYYNPANPHTVYMSPAHAPPAYDDVTKKTQ